VFVRDILTLHVPRECVEASAFTRKMRRTNRTNREWGQSKDIVSVAVEIGRMHSSLAKARSTSVSRGTSVQRGCAARAQQTGTHVSQRSQGDNRLAVKGDAEDGLNAKNKRRDVLALSMGSLVASVLLGASPVPGALADETGAGGTTGYLEVSVDRKPFGRIEIEVFSDPKSRIGEQRFLDLCKEVQGVGYKRGKISRLLDSYVSGGGLTNLSYTADGRTGITGGVTAELLEDELDSSTRKHDVAGLVSLNVRPRKELEAKDSLKAIDGKFVNVTQTFGLAPNGTEFSITTGPAPDLDGINLIVGRVVSGLDVVEALQRLPKVKNNQNSAFFKAGKLAKDRRADVAELGFDRPFSSVIIAKSGVF
jgi:cyclophilin family peptidyl-prolyl cis-trans isomerase